MGQAKQRGTYQQRLAAGKQRMAERELERARDRAAREAAWTPEERKKRHEARMLMATMLGIAASSNASAKPPVAPGTEDGNGN